MSEPFFALMLLALAAMDLPDPTRPPSMLQTPVAQTGEPSSAAGVPHLDSILISPSRRVAVIEGQVVREGDRIAGAQILSIRPYSVRLRGLKGLFTLRMSDPPVKLEASDGSGP